MSRTQKAFVEIIAILAILVMCIFANPAYAQDPNLSQDSVQAESQENSPATAQYSQYDQYNPSSASQYGVVELPDTGGPNLLAIGVVGGACLLISAGLLFLLLRR
jgi:LPXTG-motif cell wall-anchored protein